MEATTRIPDTKSLIKSFIEEIADWRSQLEAAHLFD
jgi:hypothetical protein